MENCRRCGVKVEKKSDLWCPKCRERVDEEFYGLTSRPFDYYMRRWIKRKRQLANLYSNNKQNGNND